MARIDVRRKVLSAARTVFSRKGYNAATVADILSEAGIARGTFYKYFPNKRQVLYEMISGLFNTLYVSSSNMLKVEEPDQFESRIRESLELSYRLFIDNRDVVAVYFREAFRADPGFYSLWDDFDRRMIALFSDVLSRGMETGKFRNVDKSLVSRAMFLLFLQVPYWDILISSNPAIDIEALAGEMVGFVINGLKAVPSRGRSEEIGGVFEGSLG